MVKKKGIVLSEIRSQRFFYVSRYPVPYIYEQIISVINIFYTELFVFLTLCSYYTQEI